MTQTDLGRLVGISQAMISAWERSKGRPDDASSRRVEKALKATFANKPDAGHFGSWLRQARSDRSMSVSELSRLSGVSAPSIYNIEAGRTPTPQPDTRGRLQHAINGERGAVAVPVRASQRTSIGDANALAAASVDPRQDFGPWLREVRESKRMTQAALGKAVGVSQTMVSTWERSTGRPDDEWIELLDQALDTRFGSAAEEHDASAETGAFGQWVRRTRIDQAMSVSDLSQSSGVSLPSIYNIETGKTPNPRQHTRARLEKALGETTPSSVTAVVQEQSSIVGLGALTDFDPHDDADLPTDPGVYVFYDISQRPIYVGQSDNIRRRVRDHSDKFWFKSPIVETASYVAIPDNDLRKKIEQILIKFLKSNAVINQRHVER
jgi:transcriptional regulator with XRE-family HTH domain